MAERCIVCDHDRRVDIDKALSVPRSDSKVARQFGFSRATIARHRAHIVHNDAVELPKELNSNDVSLQKAKVQRIIDTARDDKVRIAALRELRGYIELEARLHQEAQGTSALSSDPAFQKLAGVLASTLCGDCRKRVDALTECVIPRAVVEGGIPADE